MPFKRDRFVVLYDSRTGRFRSLVIAARAPPDVGAGDDGFLWLDVGDLGSWKKPLLRVFNEENRGRGCTEAWPVVGEAAAVLEHGNLLGLEDDDHLQYLTPGRHAGIGYGLPHHSPMTLTPAAEVLLSRTDQEVTLDPQGAHYVLIGPLGGVMTEPTFRELDESDIPAEIARDTEVTDAIGTHAEDDNAHHNPVTLGSQNPAGAMSIDDEQQISHDLTEKIGPTHILGTAIWGASGEKLLNPVPDTRDYFLFARAGYVDDSDFSATIAGIAGSTLTYTSPGGDEGVIEPLAATDIGKVVLHNTTRPENDALIDDVNVGTRTITLTAAVPGDWQTTDTITVRSRTNTDAGLAPAYYIDIDVSGTFGPSVAALLLEFAHKDIGVANSLFRIHPYEAYSAPKSFSVFTNLAGAWFNRTVLIPLVSQRFTILWQSSNTATAYPALKVMGYREEAAT